MKLSAFKVDTNKVEGGQWVRKIPDFPGIAFKVRGFSSQIYRKAISVEMDQYSRIERMSGLSADQQSDVQAKAMAEAGILDWSGIEDEDGKPLPFSKDAALVYLTDPDYRRFSAAVAFAMAFVDETASSEGVDASKN